MNWLTSLNWPSIMISLVMAVAPAYASYVNALATFETKITLVKTDSETFKQSFSEFVKEYRDDKKDIKLDIQKLLIKQGIVETKLQNKRGEYEN